MRRKRWLFLAALAACLIVALAIAAPRPAQVTKESCYSMPHGISRSKVHETLGRPYDSWATQERFIGYDGCATIFFDEKGCLAGRNWDVLPYRRHFPDSILHGQIQWPMD
jgi:hypothetical protein